MKDGNIDTGGTNENSLGPITIVLDENNGKLYMGKAVDGYISFNTTSPALIAYTELGNIDTQVTRVAVEARLSCQPGFPARVYITLGRFSDGIGIYFTSSWEGLMAAANVKGDYKITMRAAPDDYWHSIRVEVEPIEMDVVNVTLTLDGRTTSLSVASRFEVPGLDGFDPLFDAAAVGVAGVLASTTIRRILEKTGPVKLDNGDALMVTELISRAMQRDPATRSYATLWIISRVDPEKGKYRRQPLPLSWEVARTIARNYQGESTRITLKPTIPKNYKRILDEIVEKKQPYVARVVLGGFGERKNKLWIHGEIHLSIPYKFYLEHFRRYRRNYGHLFGGVDVNVDRMNLAIVDRYGRLRDVKTFWFEEASWKGCPRQRAWSIIGMAIHDMLRYAYNHGVKTLFLENPETLGYLKTLWIKRGKRSNGNYNYRVQIFRSRVVERIAIKAPLYSINIEYVGPRGTTHSKIHDEIMRRYGLDRHTASAHMIALKGLKLP